MATIIEQAQQAELALAAYANLVQGDPTQEALILAGFSQSQAIQFIARYSIVDQFNHGDTYEVTDPMTGEVIGTGTNSNGLSVTVFEDKISHIRYLAIRGTDDLSDAVSDIVDIALLGTSEYQAQYQALKAKVSEWQADGTLPNGTGTGQQQYTVTAHSLGGFLATALIADFPTTIAHTYLNNAPGLGGDTLLGLLPVVAIVRELIGPQATASIDTSKISNVKADAGSSLIADLGAQVSTSTWIAIENQFGGVSNPADARNHSQQVLSDTLALYALFAKLDPAATLAQLSQVFKAGSNQNKFSLEWTLDSLRKIVLGKAAVDATPTIEGDRNSFFINLYALQENTGFQALSEHVKVGSVGSARTDFGSFLTVYHLSSVALIATDQTGENILSAWNEDLFIKWEQDKVDTAKKNDEGNLNFSNQWLQDRARMLNLTNQINGVDLLASKTSSLYSTDFRQIRFSGTTDYGFSEISQNNPLSPQHIQIIFGSEGDDTINGMDVGIGDHLYGGDGNDTIHGKGGNDYIEGNGGDDKLLGGTGRDQLFGGDGADILNGGKDADVLNGGKGDDIYVFADGDGVDTIVDSDGDDQIKWGTDENDTGGIQLVGGKETEAGSGIWKSEDEQFTYNLVYEDDGSKTLVITHGPDHILVKEFNNGKFGITLNGSEVAPQPETGRTIVGDLMPIDIDPVTDGVQFGYDDIGNPLTGGAQGGRADQLNDSAGNDWILAKGGNDIVNAGAGGNDLIEGGSGSDQLYAGDGDDVVLGGTESDIILGKDGNDRLYGGDEMGLAEAIVIGETAQSTGLRGDWLNGGNGDDILIADAGNDSLYGGDGKDILVGGGGDDWLNGDDDYSAINFFWYYQPLSNEFDISVGLITIDSSSVGNDDILYGGSGNDHMSGLAGDDILYGGSGNDVMSGDDNDDALYGGSGDDRMTGDYGLLAYLSDSGEVVQGNDYMDGGTGNDWMQGEGGDDQLFGGAGDDELWGDAITYNSAETYGNDYLDGGDGNDILVGQAGDDTLIGGDGNDKLYGDDDFTVEANLGNDYLDGGDGDDFLKGYGGADQLFGGAGDDQMLGGEGDDYLDGEDGDDILLGDGGNDILLGADGMDELQGGDGDDFLDGGNDDDVAFGQAGNDSLFGKDGNDELQGGDGDDSLDGGAGNDLVIGDAGNDVLFGGDGDDELQGGEGSDSLQGGGGSDILFGGGGDDVLDGGEGADYLDGGIGHDVYQNVGADDTVVDEDGNAIIQFSDDIAANDIEIVNVNRNGSDTLLFNIDGRTFFEVPRNQNSAQQIFQFESGAFDQSQFLGERLFQSVYTGYTSGDDILKGYAAGDTIMGGNGNDQLFGYSGNDSLNGGIGDDILVGGKENDNLIGGDGNDTYVFFRGDGQDVIVDGGTENNENKIHFGADIKRSDVTFSRLSSGDLLLKINDSEDQILVKDWYGNTAARIETIEFEDGAYISSAELEDLIVAPIEGTDQDDEIVGTAYDDTIISHEGNDRLEGGSGQDILEGGAGSDTYLLSYGMGKDTIIDVHPDENFIELALGMELSDLTATRDGNDLFVHFLKSSDGVILKDYYLSQQNWTLKDADGETTNIEQIIDANLPISSEQDLVEMLRREYLAESKYIISSELLAAGYQLESNGEFYKQGYRIVSATVDESTIENTSTIQWFPGYYNGTTSSTTNTEVNNVWKNAVTAIADYYSIVDYRIIYDDSESISTAEYSSSTVSRAVVVEASWNSPRWDVAQQRSTFSFGYVYGGAYSGEAIGTRTVEQTALLKHANVTGTIQNIYEQGVPSNGYYPMYVSGTYSQYTEYNYIEELYAGSSDNYIYVGDSFRSIIFAGDGDDEVRRAGFVYGGNGDDYLSGAGSDGYLGDRTVLMGGDGNDVLEGGTILVGGQGDDYMNGQHGATRYLIDPYQSGNDIIDDDWESSYDSDGNPILDSIEFLSGLNPEELNIEWTSGPDNTRNQYVRLTWGVGKSITTSIADQINNDKYGIELIKFNDGTVWDSSEIRNRAEFPVATEGDDFLIFPSTVNVMDGLGGDDTIYGNNNNNIIYGGDGNDNLSEVNGSDILIGGQGNDDLSASLGKNLLDGGGDSDTLFTGYGSFLIGGQGDDYIDVWGGGNVIAFNADDGNDTISFYSETTLSLGGGIAVVDLSFDIVGDELVLNTSANGSIHFERQLSDLASQYGQPITLQIIGDDIRTYDFKAVLILFEEALAQGMPSNGWLLADALASNILSVSTDEAIGGALAYNYAKKGNLEELSIESMQLTLSDPNFGSVAQLIDSNNVSGLIKGGDSDDQLVGTNGSDVLVGGAGNDYLDGGFGDDTYVFNVEDGIDHIVDSGGIDTIQFGEGITSDSLSLGLGSLLIRIGSDANAIHIEGFDPNDVLGSVAIENFSFSDGGSLTYEQLLARGFDINGNGQVFGTNVDDRITGGVGNDTLSGEAGNDILFGDVGDDLLNGGIGIDTMTGGIGDDTYVVDNVGDIVIENIDEGTDNIQANVTYTLSSNVENLTMTGSSSINGTGNELNNTIIGNAGNNVLSGLAGNDVLTGNAGNDTLNGGSDADVMAGGQGNDAYVVDNIGDVVTEGVDEGTDLVQSSITYTLTNNVENLTLTGTEDIRGTGNILNNAITGNGGANILDGGAGVDTLIGGAGNDIYIVENIGDIVVENANEGIDTVRSSISYELSANLENLELIGTSNLSGTGNELSNVLAGNTGNNVLDGGAGNDILVGGYGDDILVGGDGNDTYFYNIGDGLDQVADTAGIDTLEFGSGLTRGDITLRVVTVNGQKIAQIRLLNDGGCEVSDQGIDLLVTTDGSGQIILPIENFSFADGQQFVLNDLLVKQTFISGSSQNDILIGDFNDNVMSGGKGNDQLYGGSGADKLYGGKQADILYGECGNDLLEGNDGADKLYGGGGGDLLYGGKGSDLLEGGDGNDTIDGGSGNNFINAGAGDDTIIIDNGSDIVQAGGGNDVIDFTNTSHDDDDDDDDDAKNTLIDAGDGNDTIQTGAGQSWVAAGKGNDIIDAGAKHNLFAFNRGDGVDTVINSLRGNDTISIGKDIRYTDMTLEKSGKDLIFGMGEGESITLKDWYSGASHHGVDRLQVITEASGDYVAGSASKITNDKVEIFDFDKLVQRFDTIRAASSINQWSVMNGLLEAHLSSSNNSAVGSDFSYQYAINGSLAGIGLGIAQDILLSENFGSKNQSLHTRAQLEQDVVKLA